MAKLSPELKTYFEHLFLNRPYNFLDKCNIVTIRANERFVATGEDLDKIWIALSGQVKVMEEFESGETYIFTKFSAPEIFGEMEALAQISRFRASLVAVTDCIFIVGPVQEYINWIKNDPQFLYERTQYILKWVMDEERSNRAYLLLSGIERIKLYFIHHFERSEAETFCILKNTRQQIADETGYSVKTVNRVIKKLSEQGLITIKGQSILITEEQYEVILESIDDKVKYE